MATRPRSTAVPPPGHEEPHDRVRTPRPVPAGPGSAGADARVHARAGVLPAEAEYLAHRRTAAGPDDHPCRPVVEELKAEAQAPGLWNLFLPSESGLTHLEYAPLAELTGLELDLAPEAINCAAPDTGNMELLHLFGTPSSRSSGCEPLLDGEIRSASR